MTAAKSQAVEERPVRRRVQEIEVSVAQVRMETPDTKTLFLKADDGPMEYTAGHFLTIDPHQFGQLEHFIAHLEDLKGQREKPRAYSLASAPHEPYVAITIKEERYVSGETPYPPVLSPLLTYHIPLGARMVIKGFTGAYTITEDMHQRAERIVHVCAGSGIVPNLSLIKDSLHRGDALEHILLYSNKTREDIIFFNDFETLRQQYPEKLKVVHCITRQDPSSIPGARQGRITEETLHEFIPDPSRAFAFSCGPGITPHERKAAKAQGKEPSPRFVENMVALLQQVGLDKKQIKQESWGEYMKLIVQIPCLNEEETLAATIADIPRQIDGIDQVEILVIDDGSTDGTSAAARRAGVDHLIRFPRNRGLGHAFKAGFDACLKLGADIIINTDGDNQYYGGDIPALIGPILKDRVDLVIGDRQTQNIAHFSFLKRGLQQAGSRVISSLGDLDIPDVASGFRAYSRAAALQLSTFTNFDHTAEHVVQAGQERLAVVTVPIRTNPKTRESRLFSNIGEFVLKSGFISLQAYARYKALQIFSAFGALLFSLGFLIGVRFLYYFFFTDEGQLHVQSLILGAILLLAGFQIFLTGLVADLIATNRRMLEDTLCRIKKMELMQGNEEQEKTEGF